MLRRVPLIRSPCSMRYVLPKAKKQGSAVNAFDWLNLKQTEKKEKRR